MSKTVEERRQDLSHQVLVLRLYFNGRNSTDECKYAFQTETSQQGLPFCGTKVRIRGFIFERDFCAGVPGQSYVADTVLTTLSHLVF